MRRFIIWALLAILPVAALAQGAYVTVMKGPATGTIAVTSTFQQVLPYNRGRIGGYLQNNGTNTMFVFLNGKNSTTGACTANATTAGSIELAPPGVSTSGDNVNFAYAGIHVADQVCITGTSGDSFSYSEGINAPP